MSTTKTTSIVRKSNSITRIEQGEATIDGRQYHYVAQTTNDEVSRIDISVIRDNVQVGQISQALQPGGNGEVKAINETRLDSSITGEAFIAIMTDSWALIDELKKPIE